MRRATRPQKGEVYALCFSRLLLLPYCCQQVHLRVMIFRLSPRFTCKLPSFRSGAEGLRTPDLRRAKAKGYVLARPGGSGYFAVLQVFYRIAGGVSSIAYGPVLARLQYCCSTQASF